MTQEKGKPLQYLMGQDQGWITNKLLRLRLQINYDLQLLFITTLLFYTLYALITIMIAITIAIINRTIHFNLQDYCTE